VGRWVRIDHRYNQPYRLTGYAWRVFFKWTGLILAWGTVNSALEAAHMSLLILATTGGLIWYAVHCARRSRGPQLTQANYSPAMPTVGQWPSVPTATSTVGDRQFNAPPNWPPPPPGWSPEPGWQPDQAWPPPPPGWQLWVPLTPPARGAPGERNSRVIPQDVKIAVSVRDQGKCVQCGSTHDLHYDHKVPWSRGGTNTVNNIQLLCGPCNRRKGADDIPV
jgi:hypothetical protein